MFYHDQTRDLLIYKPIAPTHAYAIKQAIPDAKTINGNYIAVPRTLEALQCLRGLNYVVPTIITDANYEWPRAPDIPHPYQSQKLAANFLVLHRRCFNLSDMGTGKTLACLWAADFLMRQQPGLKALIVAPLSILERVWADAIFKNFLSRRTFQILHGNAEKRCELLEKPADFFVVNFDGVGIGAHTRQRFELDGFSKALAERADIKLAIVDEASAYKDAQTKRHRIARLVFGSKPYLWLMTGTPTPQAPTDAYGLAKLVNNAYGKSFTMFRSETMYKATMFKWVPTRDGYDKARALLSPSIRVDIQSLWDAPTQTVQQREVTLTEHQKRLMKQLKNELQVTIKQGQPITAVHEAAARTKFLQISLGAVYDENHNVHLVDAKPRLEELKVVFREANKKILTLVPFRSIIEWLNRELKSEWSCEVVHGDVSAKERGRIFQSFQTKSDPRILIADPGVLSHGLNLQMATTIVFFGALDKAELYTQSIGRIHRPGQKFPTTVVQLVSNQLEREIFKRLEKQVSLQGIMLDAIAKGFI